MDNKVTMAYACILCVMAGSSWCSETNLTCLLDAMIDRGRAAYETNSVAGTVAVKKVTTVDFFLYDQMQGDVCQAFRSVNEEFEREFTRQMQQRYPAAYAIAMRSAGNPHNPALVGCWRHIEECVRATRAWQSLAARLKKRGVERITFREPQKFYLDARKVKNRCFHLPGWAFQFVETVRPLW